MNATVFCLLISVFACLGFCQSTTPDNVSKNDETILIDKKANKKYGIEAQFYGIDLKDAENNKNSAKVIRQVVLKDVKTGSEAKYSVKSDTEQAADLYFTNVWSPDEEHLILPIGKFEGFAIFKAKDALNDIKTNKFFDTIRAKSVNSGDFWHDFEKWEDNSTISFRAGLSGDMFAFKYNIEKSELYCYRAKCEEFDTGFNLKGQVKPIKKGDIEPTKVH